MTPSLEALAERQWRDYQARTPGTYFAQPHPGLDLHQAYDLQAAVSRLRVRAGDRVIGYKVGCTGPGMVEQFGMAGPIRGYLYRSEAHPSGAILSSRHYANLAIEGEMAVEIGPAGNLAAAFPVVELHNLVFRGARKTLIELVANNGLNAGVVMPGGDWLSSTKYLAADGILSVLVNGRLFGAGRLWPLSGGPAESVGWLRDHLDACGAPLAPGDLVIAGTSLGLYSVASGDHVVVGIDDVPIVECWIA